MIKCYIDKIEYRMEREFSITEQAGNKTDSTISVLVEDQPFPVAGDIIELIDTETAETIFWGTCGIPKSPKFSTGHEPKLYSIVCGNANTILGNRIVNEAFQNVTVSYIVNALFTKYISAEGISLGQISDIPLTMEAYTAGDTNLQDAISELADLVGATWSVGNDRKFYFVAEADFPQLGRTVNQSFLIGSELQQTTRDYKTRTVQYISGATDTTTPQTEAFTYDGQSTSFTTSFPLAKKPVILKNGTAVDPALIGVTGIDDSNDAILFTFSYNSQTVTYRSKTFLATGDTVAITYTGIFKIRVASYNSAKIDEIAAKTGTSGLRERVQLATNISTQADAYQLASSLLAQFSTVTGEVSFWLLSEQLYKLGLTVHATDVLTQWEFDLPQLGISGKYVITERTIEPFFADLSDAAKKWKISLKLKNRDYLKSYGETLADLYRNVTKLSIRGDEIIVSQMENTERLELTEEMGLGQSIALYATTANATRLFAPFALVGPFYPGITSEFTAELSQAHFATEADSDTVFKPLPLGSVYPV